MNAIASIPYAEFAIQSNFSFLRGASRPEELAVTASRLGLSAIGLADRNTVAGVVPNFSITLAAAWSSRMAPPTSSPIPRIGRDGGISAAC